MATANNESAWSTTAASNNTADSTITSSDSQSPDTLDNDVRNIMAARARARADQGGSLAAGGTANALTVTTNQVLSAGHLTTGLRLLLRATAANTAVAVTFAPDGLTARTIKRADGSALAIGDIRSGAYLDLVYNLASTEWRCANITPSGAGKASFSATKSANQTIASVSETQVTFNTETFDVGSFFASSTWTPPSGSVLVAAQVTVTNNSGSATQFYLRIKKDGSEVARSHIGVVPDAATRTLLTSYFGQVDGTNAFTLFTIGDAQPYDVVLGAAITTFYGYAI